LIRDPKRPRRPRPLRQARGSKDPCENLVESATFAHPPPLRGRDGWGVAPPADIVERAAASANLSGPPRPPYFVLRREALREPKCNRR
jgi:hypothetical protein